MYTYVRTCQVVLVLVPIYSTYLVVIPTYLPTVQYITWPGGGVQDHCTVHFSSPPRVFYQLSFFFSFPFVARGIQNCLQYLPYLAFFHGCLLLVFILGKVGRYCCRL